MTHLAANAVDIACWVLLIPVLGYLGYRSYLRSDNRGGLIGKWGLSLVLLILVEYCFHLGKEYPPDAFWVILPLVVLAFIWLPSVTSIVLKPLTSSFDGGDEVEKLKPYYFLAEGKRRKGLYQEAIAEIRKQLENFPGDYEGYMKLSKIQMEDLRDLAAARATLEEFVGLPHRSPNEIVSTLHLLADWQLEYGRDTAGATETLRRIIQLFPALPSAHAAEQRIAHLEEADEARRARHEKIFVVKQGEQNLGLRQATANPAAATDPHARAEELVKHLEKHPSDTDARERLAVLYAEAFQRMDLAADQLEQLIALPTESPKHVAHWLNLLTTLHIRHGRNLEAASAALRRIPERFPGGALAAVANNRMATLQGELKAGEKTAGKTMGTYEKNIGLKLSE